MNISAEKPNKQVRIFTLPNGKTGLNSRVVTEPIEQASQRSTSSKHYKYQMRLPCMHTTFHTKLMNSSRLTKFEKKIVEMNQSVDNNKLTVSSKQKQNIVKNFRSRLKETTKIKYHNLKPVDKMMLEFERELKRIKRNQFNDKIVEPHEKKDKFQIYSANLTQDGTTDNENCLKYGDGIFVLCDGHGSNGKEVAKYVCENMFEKCLDKKNTNQISQAHISQIFATIHRDLEFSGVDIAFSGASCLLAVYAGKSLFVANLGDSQAVVKYQCKIEVLSNQHTPSQEQERERVESVGAVIRQLEASKGKFSGPMRVWAPGKNSWGPGLAQTRSFGDKAARRYGIISQPEISIFEYALTEHILAICSRAIFQVMKYETIFDRIKQESCEGIQKQCDMLAMDALTKCEEDYEKVSLFFIFA